MSLREYSGSFVWPVAIIIAISIVIICAVIWLLFGSVSARAADNDPPCLTKAQAQAKWPGQWLYWHTANRCWDNVNVRSTHSRAVAAAIVSRPATWGSGQKSPVFNDVRKRAIPLFFAGVGPFVC